MTLFYRYHQLHDHVMYMAHVLLEVLQSVDDCGEKVKDWQSQPEEVDEPNRN